ncbi:hypothetical protein PWT90_07972 [Aphanocladium album]|nr:hypothetical protein PWT90_07972 [Aphanocladium album]
MNTTSMSGIVKAPGNDSMGGGCLKHNALPGFDKVFDKDRNVFIANTDSNGTYNATAWARCCEHHTVTLVDSCYPSCGIPQDVLGKDHDSSRIMQDMYSCIGLYDSLATVQLSGAYAAPAPRALPALLTAGMIFVYMLL